MSDLIVENFFVGSILVFMGFAYYFVGRWFLRAYLLCKDRRQYDHEFCDD